MVVFGPSIVQITLLRHFVGDAQVIQCFARGAGRAADSAVTSADPRWRASSIAPENTLRSRGANRVQLV
jgi:hypothetical protein